MIDSNTGTVANVSKSRGRTWNNKLAIKRVSTAAHANPAANPINTGFIPCRSISSVTSRGLAPSAIRIPIAARRCATL